MAREVRLAVSMRPTLLRHISAMIPAGMLMTAPKMVRVLPMIPTSISLRPRKVLTEGRRRRKAWE